MELEATYFIHYIRHFFSTFSFKILLHLQWPWSTAGDMTIESAF